AINPAFASTHIILGGVYYGRAQDAPREQRLASGDLDRAATEFQQAIQDAPHTPGAQVELKARISLGNVYRLKAEAYLQAGQFDAALPLFDQAIAAIQTALPLIDPGDHRLLGQT